MSHERTVPRYAHAEGHTKLCYSEDGKYIITCGSEGDIRIFEGINDDPTEKCVGEKAFAVAQKGDKLYVTSDHNNVQIFTFPDAELDGILTRFTAPVITIDVSKDGALVAAGSLDMEIHLVETATSAVTYFSGHKGAILHVSIDPKVEYLSSSSCDGTVRVWQISDQTVVKEWTNVLTPCNSFQFAESLCHISWEPLTGRLLAIPIKSEIKIYQRSTWNVIMTLSDNQPSKKFSLTTWSSCGRFLAASSTNGEIIVWNTLINRVVSSSTDKSNLNICSLCWHPESDERQLAFCDFNGQLTVANNCYPVLNSTSNNTGKTSNVDKQKPSNVTSELDFVDLEDATIIDEDDPDDPDVISIEKIKSKYSRFLNDDNTKIDEDDNASIKSYSSAHAPGIPLVELQPPFQPTSTPVHLQRRFMLFNDIGYVKQTNTEDENMIDVDFHDSSIHHAFRINNVLNHTMAALNSEALILACEKSEESSSKVVCRLLKWWDRTKEWSIEMMEDENIEAIAVANKWLSVVTSHRFLRIFSLSGVQREIVSLPGPVLCMNALKDLLFLVYHSAAGLPGEQNLSFVVYQISSAVKVIVNSQPVPISPKATLKWIGFSDQYNPCIVDSNGILNLFTLYGGIWRPICVVDTQWKGLSNHYFVIGVGEERQTIRSVLCKGSYYPSTTPLPFITEIPWQIPICEISSDKGTAEEKFWRTKIAEDCSEIENENLHKQFLATALKLFALCCQTNREMRVLELCDFTNKTDVTELALRYVSKIGSDILADKLSELRREQLRTVPEDTDFVLSSFHPAVHKERSIIKPQDIRHRGNRLRTADFDEIQDTNGYERNGISRTENDNIEFNNTEIKSDSYQSQELFPETRSTQGSTNGDSQDSVSLIAKIRKQKYLNQQISQVAPARKINPFKVQTQPTQTIDNTSDVSMQTIEEKADILNVSFPEWFKVEKNNLTKEFPDFNEKELSVAGAKKYRSLLKSSVERKNNTNLENGENRIMSDRSSTKKRKSIEDEPNEHKNAEKKKSLFKLQGFAFNKK